VLNIQPDRIGSPATDGLAPNSRQGAGPNRPKKPSWERHQRQRQVHQQAEPAQQAKALQVGLLAGNLYNAGEATERPIQLYRSARPSTAWNPALALALLSQWSAARPRAALTFSLSKPGTAS